MSLLTRCVAIEGVSKTTPLRLDCEPAWLKERLSVVEQPNALVQLVPFLLLSVIIAVYANILAREKGRNVTKWTILGLIPGVNLFCMWFFVGAANLRLERKVDELLEATRRSSVG